MITWLKQIPVVYKAIVALVAIFIVGTTAGFAFLSYSSLPNRVSNTEGAINHLKTEVELTKSLIQEVHEEVKRGNCLAMAELENKPYQKCLIN